MTGYPGKDTRGQPPSLCRKRSEPKTGGARMEVAAVVSAIMKLTSFRRKDQVHLLDLISIGLIDSTWLDRLSPELKPRLQELLEDPDG